MMRYGGSKQKTIRKIMTRSSDDLYAPLLRSEQISYIEPFFGSGEAGFPIVGGLPNDSSLLLNDKDWGLFCFWVTVRDKPELLTQRVREFEPSVDAFDEFKQQDLSGWHGIDPAEVAFRKFALHRIGHGGLGPMAGGPQGGRGQRSPYKVDSRWYPERHCADILARHRCLRRFREVEFTCKDFEEVIASASRNALLYLDPPYKAAGPQLYTHSLTDDDHRRLAAVLRSCAGSWILSYDDCPFVRGLYADWADVHTISARYSVAISKGARRRNAELVITPRNANQRSSGEGLVA